MIGIILAAGRGGRLSSKLHGKPKCLLTIKERPLILHQIDAMKAIGIQEYVVVVGYEHQQVRKMLLSNISKIHFIENPYYYCTNTLYSLWLAREYFDEDFIYFNGDILCDYRTVKAVVGSNGCSMLACTRHQCGDEEVKVVVKSKRIIEIGKHIAPAKAFGEFIGVGCFRAEDNRKFRRILDSCVADKTLWNHYFEHAVNILARESTLLCADITNLPATEIDFPEDIQQALQNVAPYLKPQPVHFAG